MASIDMHIGFLEEPQGLEEFLASEGYELDGKDENSLWYCHHEFDYPWIFYRPKTVPVAEDEEPNWKKGGYRVVSDVNLVTKDFDRYELIGEIADKITRRFNAVLYDPSLEQFFTSEDYG